MVQVFMSNEPGAQKVGIRLGGATLVKGAENMVKKVMPKHPGYGGYAMTMNVLEWPHTDSGFAEHLGISSNEFNEILKKFGGEGHGLWIPTEEQAQACADYINKKYLQEV